MIQPIVASSLPSSRDCKTGHPPQKLSIEIFDDYHAIRWTTAKNRNVAFRRFLLPYFFVFLSPSTRHYGDERGHSYGLFRFEATRPVRENLMLVCVRQLVAESQ